MTTFDDGLSEIYRVLKLSGVLLLNFPLFLYGHYIFRLGVNRKIRRLFYSESWNILSEESFVPESPYYT